MDFFYHLLAITSRYTVFVGEYEKIYFQERSVQLAEQRMTLPEPLNERLTNPLLGQAG